MADAPGEAPAPLAGPDAPAPPPPPPGGDLAVPRTGPSGAAPGTHPAPDAPSPTRGKASAGAWAVRAGIVLIALELASGLGLVWELLHMASLAALYVVWARTSGKVAAERTTWQRSAWQWFSAAGWAMVVLVVFYVLAVLTGLLDRMPEAYGATWGNREAPPIVTYPLLVVGFLHLARRRGRQNVLVRALDALLVAGGLFFVLWSSVFRDLFGDSPLAFDERIEVMSYPVMCSAVVVSAWMTLGRDGLARRSGRLIAMAATVPLGTDVADAILELDGDARGALLGEIGFLVAALLWILAARAAREEGPWPPNPPEPSTRGTLVETYLPIAVMALALGTAVQTVNEHGAISTFQFWLSAGLILTLLVRLGTTLAQNRSLERRLRDESAFKTRVLRFISHEVANPLSPLRLTAKMLRTGRAPDPDRSWDTVDRSIERLTVLSRDVREMALAETQRLVRHVEVVDAGAHVQAAADSAAPLAKQRGLELVLNAAVEPLPVRIDAQRFGQVLDNLLSNALKFTHPPGRLTVRVERDGDHVRVRVTDTGIGLSSADRDGLFQPFRRAQDGSQPGLGLGLYLCKAIMAELHGHIGVESAGRGQGSTFWVRLPLEGKDPTPLALGGPATPAALLEPVPTATIRLA